MSKDQVSNGYDSDKAAHFREAKRIEDEFIKGNLKPKEATETDIPSLSNEIEEAPSSASLIPRVPSRAEDAINIPNQNISVEFQLGTGPGAFSIIIKARTVTIADECLSIIIENNIQITPPKLSPIKIKVDGRPYNVLWAGFSQAFGKFRIISFLVYEERNNGEAGQSNI